MQALKVVAEGITTSFRRPHFMIGVQPTFRMPPPSTIYGHLCSTLGEIVDPEGIRFAYHFTYQASFFDVEHTHLVAAVGGTLPGTKIPKVQEGHINPYQREQLFLPRLVLYINRPDWLEAFRSPYYAVVLGRSQDLFSYTSVEIVTLERASRAYFEHTILPYEMATQTEAGAVELLPRYRDYQHQQRVTFERYLLLDQRVHSDEFIRETSVLPPTHWVDPTSPLESWAHLGVWFHSFVGGSDVVFPAAH